MNFGIIAAGEGSRLACEGVEVPKPLVDIDGRPMIRRLLDIFACFGPDRIAVIVNGRMQEVREYVRAIAPEFGGRLMLTVKDTPSSMHSFYEIGKNLQGHGRFVVTTVDTIFRREDFARYVEAYASAPRDVDGMMAVSSFVDDEKPLWVAADPDMKITGFCDEAPADARFVSGGIYGLGDAAVEVLSDCLEKGVSRMRNYQRALIGAGLDLRAFDMGKIIDVDHAGDIVKAREFIG